MKLKALLFLLISIINIRMGFASGSLRLTGEVRDYVSDSLLHNVNVTVVEIGNSTTTGKDGKFAFKNVTLRKVTLIAVRPGYYALVIPDINLPEAIPVTLHMVKGNSNEYLFFNIGNITVTGRKDLMPESPQTSYIVTKGEIEHMQANSLAELVSFIPGNEKTFNSGLARIQHLDLRSFHNNSDDLPELFGTKLIINDIPYANNANLLTGQGISYSSKLQSLADNQYDLREIPAENIEEVKVIPEASAEYGDFTGGVILVKTRSQYSASGIKLKNNPDTKELNAFGNIPLFKRGITYNLNWARSERDRRISGDEYQRLHVELNGENRFAGQKGRISHYLSWGRKIEEDTKPDDRLQGGYNRDWRLVYGQQLNYRMNSDKSIYMRNYISYTNRDNLYLKAQSNQVQYWSPLNTFGTAEALLSESFYYSSVKTEGRELSFGSKIKFLKKISLKGITDNFSVGGEWQTDAVSGAGKKFDILKPPGGRQVIVPRSFDRIPALHQFSFFMDNKIEGSFLLPYYLYLGWRLDSYNPTTVDISALLSHSSLLKASHGTFANPRLGIKISLHPRTQLRLTFGKFSKAPALSNIYPEDFRLNVVDSAAVPLISTYIFDRSNKQLKGYTTIHQEVALDQAVGPALISLSYFYKKTLNAPRNIYIPFSYTRYFFPEWPDPENKIPLESVNSYNTDYSRYFNLRNSRTNGIELNFRTGKLPHINMRFDLNASFIYKYYDNSKTPYYAGVYSYAADDTLPENMVLENDIQIVPEYELESHWQQKGVVNFRADYLVRSLAMWITFKSQYVFADKWKTLYKEVTPATGYYYNDEYYPVTPDISAEMGLNRYLYDPDQQKTQSKPNDKWLFSIIISKSVGTNSEFSFFVDNIFNDRAYYLSADGIYISRNPEIFWGITFSSRPAKFW